MDTGTNEDRLLQLNQYLADFLLPNTVVLFLYIFIGTFGNLLVVYVYVYRIKGKKDDRFFIPYLAVCDLVSCVLGAGFAIALNLLPVTFHGDPLCKSLWFLTKITTIVAGLVLIIIAVQRYQKVCRPFGRQMTLKIKYISLGVMFVVAVVSSFPTIFFHGEIMVFNPTANITGYRCGRYEYMDVSTEITVYNSFQLLLALGGILSVTVLYIFIAKKIYSQTRFRKRARSSLPSHDISQAPASDSGVMADNKPDDVFEDQRQSQVSGIRIKETRKYSNDSVYSTDDEETVKKRKSSVEYVDEKGKRKRVNLRILNLKASFRHFRYSLLFMFITIAFLVTYAPRMIIMLLEGINKDFWKTISDDEIRIHLFLYRFYIVNNIVNPFLYSLFDSRFKKEIKKMVCCPRETKCEK